MFLSFVIHLKLKVEILAERAELKIEKEMFHKS